MIKCWPWGTHTAKSSKDETLSFEQKCSAKSLLEIETTSPSGHGALCVNVTFGIGVPAKEAICFSKKSLMNLDVQVNSELVFRPEEERGMQDPAFKRTLSFHSPYEPHITSSTEESLFSNAKPGRQRYWTFSPCLYESAYRKKCQPMGRAWEMAWSVHCYYRSDMITVICFLASMEFDHYLTPLLLSKKCVMHAIWTLCTAIRPTICHEFTGSKRRLSKHQQEVFV